MKRINIGKLNGLYPSLTTIVGADVGSSPNWITIAHVGILNHASQDVPQYLSIGLNASHYTNQGIHEHGQFSINIPSQHQLELTDYVGLVTGAKVDKSDLFQVTRGVLDHAPMIGDCPLSMELKLDRTLKIGHHEIFIGELVSTYVDEACLTDGKPDIAKINPLLFDFMLLDYWSIGKRTGKPWRAGKAYKNRK